MSAGWVVVASLVAVGGAALVVAGLGEGAPSLAATLRSIRRTPDERMAMDEVGRSGLDRCGSVVLSVVSVRPGATTPSALRILQRRVETHVGWLAIASFIGLLAPSAALAVAVSLGAIELSSTAFVLPVGIGVALAVVAPLLLHASMLEQAAERRIDLRHQLSAFIDMVTMLLAGNTGHEGSLRQAADAGDGMLFRELRRRMRESSTTGRSLVDALEAVALDFELDELAQMAATSRLAAAEGATIAWSLTA
ncbi:MAG: hypothetical protein AAGG08_00610 [Actinomycetota bacterium]